MTINASIDDQQMLAPDINEPQVYKLTPLDGNPVSRANLQFVFFYALPHERHTEISRELRASFYQTMRHYPILYGRLDKNENGYFCLVNQEYAQTKGLPRYEEHQVGTTLEEIRKSNYNWAVWPQELFSVPVSRTEDVPLVQCVVTWHADGFGVLFSVDHTIADGIGIDILVNQWAGTVRGQPLKPADYNHESFYRGLETEMQNDWFIDYVQSLETAGPVEGFVEGKCDPSVIEPALMANVHSMRITVEALERLRQDNMEDTLEDRVSVIRLAYALMWQRYMAAKQQKSSSFLNVIHSGRHLVSRPNYIGNAVCPTYMSMPFEELMSSFADVGRVIGKHMHQVKAPQWLAFSHKMLDSEWFAKFITVFANPTASQLTVSNISRLNFYHADFGFGPPAYTTLYPVLIPGFSTWMPLGPDGGIHILWNIPTNIFNRLKADTLFCKYIDIIY
ncbi:hypothetical protein GGI25_002870 [Coemansia spiralis]|uniref:Uncharacterized protein n=2 Tax=Coemansia TaxID=4863 RepID=A0A9W8G9L9_9FUNG|nr:hypothetical protein EDC05_002840 [Coemansia umbellata]KAJ2622275.1 hypothetical protein GGI26_003428 [Coemansia sp. RSA 1358]KAJ2677772.1 hypothetical protein GGI25_002870 [Coemansia spiralis]